MSNRRNLTIRSLEARDVDVYSSLQRATFGWTVGAAPAEEHRQQLRHSIRLSESEGSKNVALVAEVDGRFAGYAVGQPYSPVLNGIEQPHREGEVGMVPQLVVVDRLRGQGIGARLLETVVDELGSSGFSMALADIKEELKSWYEHQGWTVLPPGHAFAWIETHRRGSELAAPPNAPVSLKTTHTPAYTQPPLMAHGYNLMAFKVTGAPRVGMIAAAHFPISDDPETTRVACARSLVNALEQDPPAMIRLAQGSALLLNLETMSRDEQQSYLASLGKPARS
jgi:GNAT superfamily N-acetyltransferase